MRHIQVSRNNHGLFVFGLHLENMLLEVNVPLVHSIVESEQTISRIRHICNNKNEIFKLSSNRSPLTIMLRDSYVVLDVNWVYLREDCCPRIPLLHFTAIPELKVLPRKVFSELNLI